MSRILLEDYQGEFQVDRTQIAVTESAVAGRTITEIPGKLSAIGVVNGNNRIYGRNVWAKNLSEGSPLMAAINSAASFGLLEHPKDGVVDLKSPISHLTIEAKMVGDEIHGKIRVINTPDGQKLLSLIEAGYNPKVSSRGYGSLVTRADGVDEVQDDFVCEGWDVVAKPSFGMAQLSPQRESDTAKKEAAVEKLAAIVAPQTTLQPVAETVLPEKAVQQPKPHKNNKMEIKSLKESLGSLKAVALSGVTPAKFAEGIAQMETLHEEVEAARAANGVSHYEADRIHRDIEDLQNKWQSAVEAPSKKAQSVSEANSKLIRVMKVVTETAVKLRESASKLAEKLTKKDELVMEVARRGRDWKARCELSEKNHATDKHKLEVATLALDKLKDKYIGEMTEAGRLILSREYAEFLKENADVETELKSAKHPAHIGRIRESIEAKLKPAADAAAADETPSEEGKEEAPIAESKDAKKVVAEDKKEEAPVIEEKSEPTVQMLTSRYGIGSTSVAESISLSRRLSKVPAAK